MTFINKILILLKKRLYVYGIIFLVLVLGVVFVFNNKKTTEETIVIERADFVSQVSVSGKVVAASDVSLGFSTGGRVSAVRVKVGDIVSTGAVLASVENGDFRASLEQKEADLLKEQSKLKSLQSGTRPEQLAITEASLLSAETSFSQAKQSLVNAIGDAYTKADDAIKNKIDQFFHDPLSNDPYVSFFISDNSLILSVNQERKSIGIILTSWNKSISEISSGTNLEKYIAEAGQNLEKIKSFLAEVSVITNNPNSSYSGGAIPSAWKTDTSTARLAIDTAISSLSSAVTSYKNAETNLTIKQNNLKLEQAGSTSDEIDQQMAQVKGAEAGVLNVRAMLNKTLILAPFSGQITKIDAKVGEVASSNVPLISMMSADIFQIESYVPEVNIANIKLNDEAKITLDAYGANVVFGAKVISIDPAETIKDGVSTYKIKLQFDSKDDRVKSGMTANVDIKIFSKSDVLAVPAGVLFKKDGKMFVQVKENEKIIDREVQTGGVSALGKTEIVSGLTEGEEVILNPKIE